MSKVTNPWQDVYARSYQQIKKSLLQRMKNNLPEVTDYSEGNIFIILISMFSAIAEVIHYYIDNMARETFFSTARRYSSLVKHAKMIDYHTKTAIPSSADLLITLGEDTNIASKTYSIPINTIFTSSNGLQFISVKQKTFYEGTYGVSIPIEQKVYVEPYNIGTIPDGNSIIYINENMGLYVEGSAILRVNNILWKLVETFGYSKSTDKHFMVNLSDNQSPYIQFGDGLFGEKPPVNGTVYLGYYTTKGIEGNLPENTIQTLSTSLDIPDIRVTNPNPSSGGSNYETFEMMKDHIPLSIRTLGVAITKQDYEDVAKLAPGVDKAYIDYKCGKFVDIYIVPDGGGIASEALRDNTSRYISTKKLITTNVQVLSTGSSYIFIQMSVTGKPSVRSTIIYDTVTKALISKYNFNTSEINKVVRLSDIYSLVDNLDVVDYLTIEQLYIIPYPVPSEDVNVSLNIVLFKIKKVEDFAVYTITYGGKDTFEIVSEMGETYNVQLNSEQNIISEDTSINFSIILGLPKVGTYTEGDRWTINVTPNDKDQKVLDYSVPRVILSNIVLNINETV